MPNFVTLDDGLTYFTISEIAAFGHDQERGGTWIRFTNGKNSWTQYEVSQVAELLGPCANLHR